MKSLCIVLLLGIGAQGQAPQQLGAPIFLSEPTVIISADRTIWIGGWPLDDLVLAEIPDENDANIPQNVIWTQVCQHCIDPVGAADETDGKPNLSRYLRVAEPVDVPAVQVDYVARPKGQFFSCGLNLCKAEKDIIEQRPGCADKARILEHDENSPPKYWCRKVEF